MSNPSSTFYYYFRYSLIFKILISNYVVNSKIKLIFLTLLWCQSLVVASKIFIQPKQGRQAMPMSSLSTLLCLRPGNTKGGSITVPLTSCLTGLDQSVLQIKSKIVSCHTANSKPVKQEFNGAVILPPLICSAKAVPSLAV